MMARKKVFLNGEGQEGMNEVLPAFSKRIYVAMGKLPSAVAAWP
jgi:hypothetical protein